MSVQDFVESFPNKTYRVRRSKDFFLDRTVENGELYQYVVFTFDEGYNLSPSAVTGLQETGIIEDTPESSEISIKDAQLQFDTALLLTNTVGISSKPDVVIDNSGNIHVAWQDNRQGHDEVFYGRWDAASQQWTTSARGGKDLRITNVGSRYHARNPAIIITNDGDIAIVWQGNCCTVDKEDIYLSYYDGIKKRWMSSAFGVPDIRLTDGTSMCTDPDIVADFFNNLYVTFTSDKTGSNKIYLKLCKRIIESTAEKQDEVTGCFLPPAENIQCRVVPFREAANLIGLGNALKLVPNAGKMTAEEVYNSKVQLCVDTSENVSVITYIPETGIDLTSQASTIKFASNVEVATTKRLFNKDLTTALGSPSFGLKPEDIAAINGEFIDIPVVTNAKISFLVEKKAYTHIRFATEMENIAEKSFYPFNSFEDDGRGNILVPILLSAGNGDKIVFFQYTGPDGASSIIYARLILDAGKPTFQVRLYKNIELSQNLDQYNGQQITGAGQIFVEIIADRPLQNNPTFDVLQMGANDYLNLTTAPIQESILDLAEQGFFEDFDSADIDASLQIAQQQGLLGDQPIDDVRNAVESLNNASVINALRKITCAGPTIQGIGTTGAVGIGTTGTVGIGTTGTVVETAAPPLKPDTVATRIGPFALRFTGVFEIMPADGIKYVDGEARLVVHAKDFIGNVV